jgi:hypothetical protein
MMAWVIYIRLKTLHHQQTGVAEPWSEPKRKRKKERNRRGSKAGNRNTIPMTREFFPWPERTLA